MGVDIITDTLYKSIMELGEWDFIRTCDPDDYTERKLQAIIWEFGKYGIECSCEEWHQAMYNMKYIATYGWDNYMVISINERRSNFMEGMR